MNGLNIHGDLMDIIARAQAAGIDASEAATVKLAEAGRDRMREVLSGPGGGEGSAPGRRSGELARSVRATTTYADAGVRVHVGPSGGQAHIGNILDKGWHAHGPVRARGKGSYHIRPFTEQVAEASEAEAQALCSEEVSVRIHQAGL